MQNAKWKVQNGGGGNSDEAMEGVSGVRFILLFLHIIRGAARAGHFARNSAQRKMRVGAVGV
jgi:hypothetical protein